MPISSNTAQGKNFLYTNPKSEKEKNIPAGQSLIESNIKKRNSSNESVKISSGDNIIDTWSMNSVESSLANMGMSSVRPEIITSLEFLPPLGSDTSGSELYATGTGELIDMQSQLKRIKYTEAQRFLIDALTPEGIIPYIALFGDSSSGFEVRVNDNSPWIEDVSDLTSARKEARVVLQYLDNSLVLYDFIDSLDIKNISYKKVVTEVDTAFSSDFAERRIVSSMNLYSDDLVGNKVPGRIGLSTYMVKYLGYPDAAWENASSTAVSLQLVADTLGRTRVPITSPHGGISTNAYDAMTNMNTPSTLFGADDMANTSEYIDITALQNIKPANMYDAAAMLHGGDDRVTTTETGDSTRFTKGNFLKIWDMIESENPLPLYEVAKDYMTMLSYHKMHGGSQIMTSNNFGQGGPGLVGWRGLLIAAAGWNVFKTNENFGNIRMNETELQLGDNTVGKIGNSVYFMASQSGDSFVATLNHGNGDTPTGVQKPIPGREYYVEGFFDSTDDKLKDIAKQSQNLQMSSEFIANILSWSTAPHAWAFNNSGKGLPTGMKQPSTGQPGCPASYFTDTVLMVFKTFLKKRFDDVPSTVATESPVIEGGSGWTANERFSSAMMMLAANDPDAAFEMFRCTHMRDVMNTGIKDGTKAYIEEHFGGSYIETYKSDLEGATQDFVIAAELERWGRTVFSNTTHDMLEKGGEILAGKLLDVYNFQDVISQASNPSMVSHWGDGYDNDEANGGMYSNTGEDMTIDGHRIGLSELQAKSVSSTSYDQKVDTYYKFPSFELSKSYFLGSGGTARKWSPRHVNENLGMSSRQQSTNDYDTLDWSDGGLYGGRGTFMWDLARKAVSSFESGMAEAMGITNANVSDTSAEAYLKGTITTNSAKLKYNRGARVCVAFILLCHLLKKTQKMAMITNPTKQGAGASGPPNGVHFMWSKRAMWSFINAMEIRNKSSSERNIVLADPGYKKYDNSAIPASSKYGSRDGVESCLDTIYSFIVPQLEFDMNALNSGWFFSQFSKKTYTAAETVISTFAGGVDSEVKNFIMADSSRLGGDRTAGGLGLGKDSTLSEVLSKMLSKEQVSLGRYLEDSLMHQNRDFPIFPASEVVMKNQTKCLSVISRLGRLQEKDDAGQKRIMTVGLPAGLVKTLRRAATQASSSTEFSNTCLVKISLWRRNLVSEEIVETPQSYIFDISKFVVEGRKSFPDSPGSNNLDAADGFHEGQGIKDLIENFVIRTYDESGCTQSVQGHAYSDQQRTSWIDAGGDITGGSFWGSDELVDVTDGQLGTYFPHDSNGSHRPGGTSQSILDYVSMNHIVDHYLKMYMKVTMGIDVRETTFPLTLNSGSPPVQYNTFNDSKTFDEIDQKLALSYPTRDEAASISYNRLREEVKRSSVLSPRTYRNRVLYPKAFDRIFSFIIDDSSWPRNTAESDRLPEDSYGLPTYEQTTPGSAHATTKQFYPRYFQYFATISLLPDLAAVDPII